MRDLPKDIKAYERLANVAQALASPIRLEILELLAQSPRRVDELASLCDLPVKSVSHHLQKLKTVGLVDREARGREGIYSLADEQVASTWTELAKLTGQEEDIPEDLENVTLIDVRPQEEFNAGHIKGAVSVPLRDLSGKLAEIPRDKMVVAVCRGSYCKMADLAVSVLKEKGFKAVRMSSGVLEWRAKGKELISE